jgi:signal transduction histidine kinase
VATSVIQDETTAIEASVIARLRQGLKAATLACPGLTAIFWVVELASGGTPPPAVQMGRIATVIAGFALWFLVRKASARTVFASAVILCCLFMVYPCFVLSRTEGAISRDLGMIPLVFLFAPFMLPFPPRWLVAVQTLYLASLSIAMYLATPADAPTELVGKAVNVLLMTFLFSIIVGVRHYSGVRSSVIAQRRLQEESRRAALGFERARMARDLHDHVGADLSGIALRAEREKQRASDADREAWAWTQSMVAMSLEALRDAIWALSDKPRKLDELLSLVRRRAEDNCQAHGMRLAWNVAGQPAGIPVRSELTAVLSSVFREAVVNAIRHSGSSDVTVRIGIDDDLLHFTISDTGKGLGHGSEEGRGLGNIRARVREIGGEAEIVNGPHGGVVVSVRIPDVQDKFALSSAELSLP